MTNKEQYKAYAKRIEEMKERFFKDENVNVPETVYEVSANGSISTYEIEKVSARSTRYFDIEEKQRYTKKDVESIKEFTDTLDGNLCIFIYYKCEHARGSLVSGAWKYSDYLKSIEENSIFFDMEIAEVQAKIKSKEYLDIYGPKEGHINCAYCNKSVKKEMAVSRELIFQGRNDWGQRAVVRQTNKYCPGRCGGYDQMAHEG